MSTLFPHFSNRRQLSQMLYCDVCVSIVEVIQNFVKPKLIVEHSWVFTITVGWGLRDSIEKTQYFKTLSQFQFPPTHPT